MPSPILNTDWLNQNANRNYPLVDGCSRIAANGLTLPNGLLLDISLPVPIGTVEPGDLFVQRVIGFSTGLVLTVSDRTQPTVVLASATVFLTGHRAFDSYSLVGQGVLLGMYGRLTLGDPLVLLQASKQTYDFQGLAENSRLVVHAVRPYVRGVTGIQLTDGISGETHLLTGVVEVVAGENIVLQASGGQLIVNSGLLDPGEAAHDCGCTDADGASGTEGAGQPIRTINGIEPDDNGNFTIAGQDCMGVSPLTHGIELVDSCADPCCSCEQLDVLYRGLQAVETESGRLQEVGEQLRGRIDNLQTVMLNSQLNAPGGAKEDTETGVVWFLPIGPGGYGGVWVGG